MKEGMVLVGAVDDDDRSGDDGVVGSDDESGPFCCFLSFACRAASLAALSSFCNSALKSRLILLQRVANY